MMVFGAHGRAALLPLGAALLVVAPAAQADSFLARDVQVRGLVRLTAPSVLAPLPVQAGQTVTDAQIAESIRQASPETAILFFSPQPVSEADEARLRNYSDSIIVNTPANTKTPRK